MSQPKKENLPSKNPPTGEASLSTWEMRCLEFVENYLSCFNASEAARKMGYKGASASSQGWEYFHHEFTQAELTKRYQQHADENLAARNEIISMLYREANFFGEGSSHSARVKAQTQLSKIFGMETLRVKAEVEHTGGVMLIPMAQGLDEWKNIATTQQAALMADAIDI